MAGDDGVDVHFLNDDVVIFGAAAGGDFEAIDERGGFGSAVGFDESDDDIDLLAFEPMGLEEHAIGFSDARAVSEIDLEPAPLGPADHLEE
jgi:hypothetical protein